MYSPYGTHAAIGDAAADRDAAAGDAAAGIGP